MCLCIFRVAEYQEIPSWELHNCSSPVSGPPPPPPHFLKPGGYSFSASPIEKSYFIINITHTHSLEMKMLRIAQNMIPPPIPQPVRMDIEVNVSSFNYHYFYRIYILL